MDQGRPAIEVKNLFKSFKLGKYRILRGMNLSFPHGKLTYILGPSGTGKSVLLKHILGLLKPDSGEIWIHGNEISKLHGRQLLEHRLNFGMLFQDSALFDDMTVYENVSFPLREHTNKSEAEMKEAVTKALTLLGMPAGYDKYPSELSGGMRKRVGLARAIIREPQILLYDEPTTGLDPVTRTTVDDLIATLKRELKLTSIVISHDIPSAIRLADQIAFLYQGEVAFLGTGAEFKKSQHPEIRKFLDAELRTVEAFSQ